ncbi:HAMP domain-containing histidine kinase [Novosphingobium piscinae]|uniref:histidine kinase n=1 Tax=Novosphingobium piscinae TaxID=1507448 RepID=A0A7X1FXC0_9SPHN|nr:HAMP domain-containing histidine kinase [Novosphingobium piscinae]MBC2668626.1 HAMP domain-containing histidine kinase [Novosphingobium piscinae]
MYVDDRLATVLAVSATGENQARVQFRQLVDLLGTLPADGRGPLVDAAMLRLAELGRRLSAEDRAVALDRTGVRLRNPRLVAELACDHPRVGAAAVRNARLSEEQWLDILPALPPGMRGLLRQRPDLGPALAERLDQLGAGGPGLPAPDAAAAPAGTGAKVLPLRGRGEPAAPPAGEPADGPPGARDGIGAIVRRIEAFRRSREGARPAANDAPLLPLVEEPEQPRLQAFAFACDSAGRICWTDAPLAGMVVGLLLPLAERPGGALASAFRRRLPVRGAVIELGGAPALAGPWQLDAAPEFDRDGHFTGYLGKARRPVPAAPSDAVNPEAVRVRQILHELRTPVNAIQGFAELIHQQLVGPVPHGYRALAASVAADAAQMLAGFDELERLARLDSAAMVPETGTSDLAAVLSALMRQLEPFTAPRHSGFVYTGTDQPALVELAPDEAERLGWRLLATLAGATRPGELLDLALQVGGGTLTLTLALPEAIAALPDPFEGPAPAAPQAVSGGLFGTGFALRLAAAEARGAGGSLVFRDGHAVLSLPAATAGRLTGPGELPNPAASGVSSTG